MGNPKRCKEGFSLVEMIIAIAIVGIVMSGVVLLISYSTNNMRRTSNMVNLQNETKDAMMHMSTYIQEGTDAWFDDGEDKALYIISGKKNLTGALSDGITVCRYKFVPDPSTGEETSSERYILTSYRQKADPKLIRLPCATRMENLILSIK